MRRREGVEVQKGAIAFLAGTAIVVVVLMFLVPALGWFLFALGVLGAGIAIYPRGRPERSARRR